MSGSPASGATGPRTLLGYLLLALAAVTCPCHLPLLLLLLAGTGAAGALGQYFGATGLALSVVFLVSLYLGLRALRGSGGKANAKRS